MEEVEAIRVAILAKPQAVRRIASLLEGDTRLEVVVDGPPDVVIVDGGPPPPEDVGVISLEDSPSADVVLRGPTAAELRLACRLLGENVRLRRRLQGLEEHCTSLVRQAQTDSLTGLPNRRAWDDELASRGVAAGEGTYCLAIADLDHFKVVNDTHGYPAGDAVLQAVAAALAGGVRSIGFVVRLGGDEFGLLLSGLDVATAPAVLERIRAAVPRRLAEAALPPVTASIGYALSAGSAADTSELFARADAALHRAKQAGRDRVASWTES